MTWPLTPWMTGKPNKVGVWLTRFDEDDCLPQMMMWNGREWRFTDGSGGASQPRDFCGLAFDPASVRSADSLTRFEADGEVHVVAEIGWWVPKP